MICKSCGKDKEICFFYKHPKSKTGHDSTCKECRKKAVRDNRKNNIEYYRKYDKERARLSHRVKARKEYAKTDAGKSASIRARKRYIEKNAVKRGVHIITGNAIRDGKLIKKPCEVCGCEKVHAHHDDYAYPLIVRWLCPTHHKQWHDENGEGKNSF